MEMLKLTLTNKTGNFFDTRLVDDRDHELACRDVRWHSNGDAKYAEVTATFYCAVDIKHDHPFLPKEEE